MAKSTVRAHGSPGDCARPGSPEHCPSGATATSPEHRTPSRAPARRAEPHRAQPELQEPQERHQEGARGLLRQGEQAVAQGGEWRSQAAPYPKCRSACGLAEPRARRSWRRGLTHVLTPVLGSPPPRLHRRSSLACMCRLTRSSCATKGLRRSTTAKVGTRRPSSRPSLLRSQLAAAELACARFTGPPWLRWCGALDAGIDDSCGRLWLGGSVSWVRLSLRSHRMCGLAYWAAPHCAVVCDGVPK